MAARGTDTGACSCVYSTYKVLGVSLPYCVEYVRYEMGSMTTVRLVSTLTATKGTYY